MKKNWIWILVVALLWTSIALAEDLADLTDQELLSLKEKVEQELELRGIYEYIELFRADKGDRVLRLQERLAELGYYTQSFTGKFDNTTQKAMKRFERANGLPNDGLASIEDQEVLFSLDAVANDESVDASPSPQPTKTPEPWRAEYVQIDYEEYARYPEKYQGEKVVIKGTVAQVMGTRRQGFQIRLAVMNNYTDMLFVEMGDPGYQILEGDRVTVYARLNGLITYTATFGQSITIPRAMADTVELIGN